MRFTQFDATMENADVGSQNGGHGREDSLHSLGKEREPCGADGLSSLESNSKRLVRRLNPERILSLSFKQLQNRKKCVKDPYPQSTGGEDCRIPRHMVNVNEKYLRRCLELIHVSASKAATSKISVNFSNGMMSILAGGSNGVEIKSEETFDTDRFVFQCPLVDGVGSVVISPSEQGIAGSVTGSKSMVNLLRSPLYRQFGASDGNVNFRTNSEDDKAVKCYNFMNSSGGLGIRSPQKLLKEVPIPENHNFGLESLHKRLASESSTNSTCSDQPSPASARFSQGMLQCAWRSGNPHFVFSVDGQKEVYVANLSKADSANDKSLDFVYLLHSTKGSRRAHEICDVESHLVGKMKVSTSFTLCPNNSKIMETKFILYGNNENHVGEMQTSSHSIRKIKGLSKKVADVFRTSYSSKQRTVPKFSGASAILESCPWDPHQDTSNYCDELGEVDLLEKHIPPNYELAAIVVRDHIPDNKQREVGGWGLKFLKNAGIGQTQTIDSLDASVTSECCAQNTSCLSTSMDIVVPAGLHGGPKTRNGGPSSLIDRWKSGGCCDCGGWDMGCPITVLNNASTKEASHKADAEKECKAFDLFVKAAEHRAPTLRMVNVHDGLYSIHFQSVMSALQSFSVAVAFMHTRSPSLRPKHVQELK